MVSFFERPFRQIGFTLCALFFGAIASEAAPDPELKAYAFEGVHMGTLFRITLYADQREKAEDAARSALERVESLNQKLSDYLPESELMKLCEQPAEKPVKVSRDLFEVLSAGKRLAANTGGGFDITAGHLTNLWRRAKRKGHLPEPEILANALKRTGYRFLTLDSDTQTATLHAEEMLLDLGGIAKGFAADAALLTLRDSGISRAIVAAGGDIAVGDPPPGEVGWPVSVSSLDAPSPGEPTVRIRIANCGISTSGDTRQSAEIGGIRYSHIIDPRTGIGLTERIGVTVIARSATLSDSLATAASVLGWEQGRQLIENEKDTEARLVRPKPGKDSDGDRFEIITSSGFPDPETPASAPD